MYTYEERMNAIKLYIKYDLSVADTVRNLGYPNRNMLRRWYKEYQETGGLHKEYKKRPRHTQKQMQEAVNYYLEHGRNISRTIGVIGYPSSRETLRKWLDQLAPGQRKARIKRSAVVKFSHEQKREAVIELCAREGPAAAVADGLELLGTASTNGKRSYSVGRQ